MTDVVQATPELSPGTIVPLTIHDIAFGGEGVARYHDFVIFVPFVLLGEQIEAEVVEVKKRFARAKLLKVIQSSPHRVQPLCPYFGDCGGCQYQHIDYASQLEIKRKQVADLFQRVGGFSPDVVAPVIPNPQPYGYRNRIMIRSQWDKFKQALNIGFIRADNRLVVDITECKIAEPALSDQIQQVRANPPPKGGIKVVLRIMPEDWQVPRDSFFQNNFFLLPQLIETVRSAIKESGSRFLIDAYCGVGFFGIELADLVDSFVGVEVDPPAIKAARQNASNRKVTNGEFIAGATETLLSGLLTRFEAKKTTIVIDPPRTGCPPESLELLRKTGISQIIYVSCHPATLARDLNILCSGGVFELRKVTPVDMFSQTQHVECVADLRFRSPVEGSA
ncbi:MAG TPA: class I SAM-dependent RNA methyltransferase [Candidatus Saccharimonadales bacterium]|nr:class I SAM-dependent RNA methyltransferase [Candidatus Saccharimonadales bacterium]